MAAAQARAHIGACHTPFTKPPHKSCTCAGLSLKLQAVHALGYQVICMFQEHFAVSVLPHLSNVQCRVCAATRNHKGISWDPETLSCTQGPVENADCNSMRDLACRMSCGSLMLVKL